MMRSILLTLVIGLVCVTGCTPKPPPMYGTEGKLYLPGSRQMVWAVAPAVNLSGQKQVDPILQADLVFQQLQEVEGLVVIPVNRVVEVYIALRMEKVESEAQGALVCQMLGCDALVVPTVTLYDPYEPPKFGGAIQLFGKPGALSRASAVDVHALVNQARPAPGEALPGNPNFLQVVGMFDASNGSIRSRVLNYAHGRHDPIGPYGAREYVLNMDRYCSFAWHELAADLLQSLSQK